jgi:NAD(P)-dependent dehydrogenase (short-subunit alcohol dehydrogenase family)
MAGRIALVTGAAKRLGRAVALALADDGVNVIVHYSGSQAAAEATARDIRRRRRKAWTIRADLADPQQTEGLLPAAVKLAGPIDYLVNNASIFTPSLLTDFTLEDLRANVQINALAPLVLARAFAAQKREGAVVNFLDARIADYDREHVAYHLSKRMLHALTKMMALEFAPRVRVNAVAPGLILPPPGKTAAYLRKLVHTNPLRRIGTPEGVAAAVVFLLRSEFVTGQVIYVDGGRNLKGCVYG